MEVPNPKWSSFQKSFPIDFQIFQLTLLFKMKMSRTLDLIKYFCGQQENPPPGSYEVSMSHDTSQGKKLPAAPRTEVGKRKKGSFLSSSTRFAPPRDIFLEKPEINNPGKENAWVILFR